MILWPSNEDRCLLIICKNGYYKKFKVIVHPKIKFYNLLTLKLFQNFKNEFQQWNTKDDILKSVGNQTVGDSY